MQQNILIGTGANDYLLYTGLLVWCGFSSCFCCEPVAGFMSLHFIYFCTLTVYGVVGGVMNGVFWLFRTNSTKDGIVTRLYSRGLVLLTKKITWKLLFWRTLLKIKIIKILQTFKSLYRQRNYWAIKCNQSMQLKWYANKTKVINLTGVQHPFELDRSWPFGPSPVGGHLHYPQWQLATHGLVISTSNNATIPTANKWKARGPENVAHVTPWRTVLWELFE